MTSRLDRLGVGSGRVAVGEAAGSFDVDRHVVGCRRLVLLAAGTGITPMIRIIRQVGPLADFRVLPGFTGLYRVTLGCIRFSWVSPGFHWVLPGLTWLRWVLLGSYGFDEV